MKPGPSLWVLCVLFFLLSCREADRYVTLGGYAQGGTYAVKLNLKGVRERPQAIQVAVDSLLKEIDFTLSGYNKASLLSRLNAGDTIRPNALLCEVYRRSYDFYSRSGGAFDVACGPLFDIWGFGFTHDSLPGPDRIAEAAARSGMGRLRATMEEALSPDGFFFVQLGAELQEARGHDGGPGHVDGNDGLRAEARQHGGTVPAAGMWPIMVRFRYGSMRGAAAWRRRRP